jgi:hypothetical protein
MSTSYDEILVGCVAITLALISLAIAIGPWDKPYQLGSVSAIHRRFGKFAARIFWVVLALASFSSGVIILSGLRPSYAVQSGSRF